VVMRRDVSIAKGNGLSKKQMRENRTKFSTGYVYFIRMGDDGPIKIGKAHDPAKRLFSLQTGNPLELKMLLLVRNSELEPAFHEKFWDYRIRGEWFYPDESLEDFISLTIHQSTGLRDVAGRLVPVAECNEKELPSIRSSATKAISFRDAIYEIDGSPVPLTKVMKLLGFKREAMFGRKRKSGDV
jgi:hypothetical protein